MRPSVLERAVSATLMPGFAGPELPDWVAAELADGLGAVCLFGSNIVDPEQVRQLTDAIHGVRAEALIAVDEEGGDVTRLHHRTGSPYASAAFLGRQDSLAATEATGYGIGAELRASGIDLNLAPDADINSNPRNPVIGVRSFGAEPPLVARHVAAYTRGVQSAGVAACAKHFPGHGDTATDSHLDLPVVAMSRRTLIDRELLPFAAAVDAGTLAVMTSHILVPGVDPTMPATLSAPVLDLLRAELGFKGAIVSDALDLTGASRGRGIAEAAVLALAAGCDLLCIGADNTGAQLAAIRAHVVDAVRGGRLAEGRVMDAAARVAALSAALAGLRSHSAPTAEPAPLDQRVFWKRAPVLPVTAPLLVKLDSANNIAAAETVWGIDEHLRADLDRWLPGARCVTVADRHAVNNLLTDNPARALVVQGRDLARVPFLADAVALIRRERPDAIVVELGWPDSPATYDIATYGAGRGASTALIRLLSPRLPHPPEASDSASAMSASPSSVESSQP